VQDAPGIAWDKIEPAVEIADPKLSVVVSGQRRNIPIAQNSRARFQDFFPTKSMFRKLIHAIPRQDVNTTVCPEELLHFREIRGGLRIGARSLSGQGNTHDALIFRPY